MAALQVLKTVLCAVMGEVDVVPRAADVVPEEADVVPEEAGAVWGDVDVDLRER